jgi:hypothetical protein
MKENDEYHVPAALLPETNPDTIEYEARFAAEWVWNFWENLLAVVQ